MEKQQATNIYNAIQNLYNMDNVTWQEVLAVMYNTINDLHHELDSINTKITYVEVLTSPIGTLTPKFIGQSCFDVITSTWYKSVGLSNQDWKPLTN